MKDYGIYKVGTGRVLDPDEVERIAGESSRSDGDDVRGVQIERIDVTPGGTVVFVTGTRESARRFSDGLRQGQAERGDVWEASPADLAARDPATG